MFTPKRFDSATARPVSDCLFMQIRSIGGSSDSDVTALAVVPYGRSSWTAVITVTPLAKWLITSRNSSEVKLRASIYLVNSIRAHPDRTSHDRRAPGPRGGGTCIRRARHPCRARRLRRVPVDPAGERRRGHRRQSVPEHRGAGGRIDLVSQRNDGPREHRVLGAGGSRRQGSTAGHAGDLQVASPESVHAALRGPPHERARGGHADVPGAHVWAAWQ